ncbi:MAG: RHS repeat-associated core domain-containing protein, partial [Thermocrispum sp.]
AYDAAGSLVAVTDPAGAVTRNGYNERGGLTSVTDALGSVRRVQTNPAGLPLAVTDGLGATTRYLRDVFGRVHTVADPAGGRLRMSWTIEGKLLSRVLPGGASERWRYDGEGNLIEHTDAVGQVTRTEYGHFDLPAAQTAADGTRLQFGYDSVLRLTSVTNQQGMSWRYEYDRAGHLTSETDFNGRALRYWHDAAGQLLARVNGAGETVTFTRDPLGNVVEKQAGDAVTTFEFDPAGRMLRASSPEVELLMQRDPLGRVLAESVNGRTVRSTYDALGRRVSRRTPSGAESAWAYDANDQPVSLTSGGHTLRFGYDATGREVQRQFGAGAVLAQSWDANHRLTGQTVTAPDLYSADQPARLVQQRAYHYRPDGYLVGIDDRLSGSRRYDLDRAGRVTAVHGNGWTERYAYDAAGNITQAQWPAAAPEAQGPREYTGTLIKRAGNTAYQHDAQGRLVQRRRRTLSGQQQAWAFDWDAEDRLLGVTTPDGARWRYRYDPLGRRVAKERLDASGSVDEQTTFTWDGVTLAEQTATGPTPDGLPLTPTSTTVWDFEPGSFRPLTQTERVPGETSQEWVDQQFYALVTDLIGTPTEMVDPDGDLAWRSYTTLWGQALAQLTSGPSCPLRFPGQYHDPETGDNYNYFRYYDPAATAYSAADPIGLAGGAKQHSYVPNPLRWIDALGLTPSPGGCQSGSQPNPPPPANTGPISMDQAVDLGSRHVGGTGQMGVSGSQGYQFMSHNTDADARRVTSIARFDINPNSSHVQQFGPHLNLETHIDGTPVRSGPYNDPHIPIDPSTIRPGDTP